MSRILQKKVHLSFIYIADTCTKEEDRNAAHLHLFTTPCAGKAKRLIRSLPGRRRSTVTVLVTDLRSAFSSADGSENKVQAHSAMLELPQRKEESSLGELDVPLSSPIQNMTIS